MTDFFKRWFREHAEYKDGKIRSVRALWARLPLPKKWEDKVTYTRESHDFEGHPMTLVNIDSVRCPDRDRALEAGGAVPTSNGKPYYTLPLSVCRKCPNRVPSRLHKRRYACKLLRDQRKDDPSVASQINDAIKGAKRIMGSNLLF